MSPACGAIIEGLDLSGELTNRQFDEIHAALLDRKESDMLLGYLFDYLRTPEFQYRHKWQVNDLAIWDNRTSLHYALFDYTEHRLMHRIVIQGDVPHD
jgi:taurine dioxygenase